MSSPQGSDVNLSFESLLFGEDDEGSSPSPPHSPSSPTTFGVREPQRRSPSSDGSSSPVSCSPGILDCPNSATPLNTPTKEGALRNQTGHPGSRLTCRQNDRSGRVSSSPLQTNPRAAGQRKGSKGDLFDRSSGQRAKTGDSHDRELSLPQSVPIGAGSGLSPSRSASSALSSSSSSSSTVVGKGKRERSLSISEFREYERDKNAVLVHSAKPLPIATLLECIERECGSHKTYHYRDKQSFCFVQFDTEELANKAVVVLSKKVIEPGVEIVVERCNRVTPGKDPRLSPDAQRSSAEHNSTLVVKNLPFSLKQEELNDILSSYEVQPENVAFHYDSSGMFRGMAFIKYQTVEDAVAIFDVINGMDVGGRPIRVEYKRKREQKVAQATDIDPNDEEMKKLYDQLVFFKEQTTRNDLTFPPSLTSYQRRQIHLIAEKLGMQHYMEGEGEHRYLVISKKRNNHNNNNHHHHHSNSGGKGNSGNWSGSPSFGGMAVGPSRSAERYVGVGGNRMYGSSPTNRGRRDRRHSVHGGSGSPNLPYSDARYYHNPPPHHMHHHPHHSHQPQHQQSHHLHQQHYAHYPPFQPSYMHPHPSSHSAYPEPIMHSRSYGRSPERGFGGASPRSYNGATSSWGASRRHTSGSSWNGSSPVQEFLPKQLSAGSTRHSQGINGSGSRHPNRSRSTNSFSSSSSSSSSSTSSSSSSSSSSSPSQSSSSSSSTFSDCAIPDRQPQGPIENAGFNQRYQKARMAALFQSLTLN